MTKILLAAAFISSLALADAAMPPNMQMSLNHPTDKANSMESRKALREARMAEAKAQAEKVRVACEADVASIGCKDGPMLMKCVSDYKRAHKDFQFSEGCANAMKERTENRLNRIKESQHARKPIHEMHHIKSEGVKPVSQPASGDSK
jgi:cyclopropane fatty-acyl-phospholipid synthase-like methyltransferase